MLKLSCVLAPGLAGALPFQAQSTADLIDGIGVAKPAEVAAYFLQPNVKALSY